MRWRSLFQHAVTCGKSENFAYFHAEFGLDMDSSLLVFGLNIICGVICFAKGGHALLYNILLIFSLSCQLSHFKERLTKHFINTL
jgi:hypothetical protein